MSDNAINITKIIKESILINKGGCHQLPEVHELFCNILYLARLICRPSQQTFMEQQTFVGKSQKGGMTAWKEYENFTQKQYLLLEP
jgi:hypothetical protein